MTSAPTPIPTMTRGLTLLFAVAGGIAVGNLYWSQPLLELIAHDLGSTAATAGWLVTSTQLGYAAGILLIVPLGDILERRRLLLVLMLSSAAALVLCALAPSIGVLLATVTLVGLSTVAGQILTPLAGDLADDERRGRVVGTVVSGLLTGILASRVLSGIIGDAFGWRTVYAGAAVVATVLAFLLHRALPSLAPKTRLGYRALIASVFTVVARERVVRWTLVLTAIGFGTFTLFWTSLTFLLSSPPFGFPASVIGLFGLAGLGGALAAQRAGRVHDRGWSLPATGIAWTVILACFALAVEVHRSVVVVLVMVVLVDVALQVAGILNQLRALAVSQAERSRLNTAVVTSNFLGGAVGSAAAALLWTHGGWSVVCLTGVGLSGLALVVWAVGRRGPLVSSGEPAPSAGRR